LRFGGRSSRRWTPALPPAAARVPVHAPAAARAPRARRRWRPSRTGTTVTIHRRSRSAVAFGTEQLHWADSSYWDYWKRKDAGRAGTAIKGYNTSLGTHGVERAEALVLDDARGDAEGPAGGAQLQPHLQDRGGSQNTRDYEDMIGRAKGRYE